MKNAFEFSADGLTASVWLRRRDGTVWECRIDSADFKLVSSIPGTWCAMWDDESQTFYAITAYRVAGKRKTVLMHRLVTSAPAGTEVDHGNHEGLDNRRSNLTVTSRSGNALNRQGANRNSKSGLHGVYFHAKTGKFRGWIRADGRRKEVGAFDTAEAAAEARRMYLTKGAAA
jgi:hypothetical protein